MSHICTSKTMKVIDLTQVQVESTIDSGHIGTVIYMQKALGRRIDFTWNIVDSRPRSLQTSVYSYLR